MMQIKKLTLTHKKDLRVILEDFQLVLNDGDKAVIIGEEGNGKSTLLNMLAGLEKPSKGEIVIAGKHMERMNENQLVAFRRDHVGFIFQSYNLLQTMNAVENVAFPLSFRGVPKHVRNKKAMKYLKLVGLEKQAKHMANAMSGGQQQRVASARAMITNPSLILADEPTGALDSKSARMLLESFETLNRELGATILMVTHDAFTASYCKRILFIKDGKIFNELLRGADTRKAFFEKIIEVVTLLGGDNGDVL